MSDPRLDDRNLRVLGEPRLHLGPIDPQKGHARYLRGEPTERLDCRLVLQNNLGAWQLLPSEKHRAQREDVPRIDEDRDSIHGFDGGQKKEAPEGAPVVTAPLITYAGRLTEHTALEACRQAEVAVSSMTY